MRDMITELLPLVLVVFGLLVVREIISGDDNAEKEESRKNTS